MSYNITEFKVKKLESLVIPVQSLFQSERTDWHPEQKTLGGGLSRFSNEFLDIVGTIKDGFLHCTSIDCVGEGSGTSMRLILEPALKNSEGEFIAVCVWEGGDSISRLVVQDGEVDWIQVEL